MKRERIILPWFDLINMREKKLSSFEGNIFHGAYIFTIIPILDGKRVKKQMGFTLYLVVIEGR